MTSERNDSKSIDTKLLKLISKRIEKLANTPKNTIELLMFFERIFFFDFALNAPNVPEPTAPTYGSFVQHRLMDTLLEKFGLRVLLESMGDSAQARQHINKRLRKSISAETGLFRLERMFADRNRPLRLEVCSGRGEWAIAQAQAESDVANWATLELRHDRVYQGVVSAIFKRVQNLAFLGGDAMLILPRHIPVDFLSFYLLLRLMSSRLTVSATFSSTTRSLQIALRTCLKMIPMARTYLPLSFLLFVNRF
jgi:hypothetical protein